MYARDRPRAIGIFWNVLQRQEKTEKQKLESHQGKSPRTKVASATRPTAKM